MIQITVIIAKICNVFWGDCKSPDSHDEDDIQVLGSRLRAKLVAKRQTLKSRCSEGLSNCSGMGHVVAIILAGIMIGIHTL